MRGVLLLMMLLAGAPAAGQGGLILGRDLYRAGSSVILSEGDIESAFLAGEWVRIGAEMSGSAHLAGRRVEIAAPVAGSLYAAGMHVAVTAPIGGGASLAGRDVAIDAPIGGSLRAAGSTIRVSGEVGGGAFLNGGSVTLDAPVRGDVALGAESMSFGPEARIDGRLVLLVDEGEAAVVPTRVVPPERIEVRTMTHRDARAGPERAAAGIAWLLASIIVVALLATLAAALAPTGIEALRDEVGLRPVRTFGLGFLTLSALVGGGVIIGLTLIGLLLVPAVVLVTLLTGFVGYVLAVYMLGASIYRWRARGEPDSLRARALAALIGSALAAIVFLVPFLGWLFMLGLVLFGTGGLTRAAFGRRLP